MLGSQDIDDAANFVTNGQADSWSGMHYVAIIRAVFGTILHNRLCGSGSKGDADRRG